MGVSKAQQGKRRVLEMALGEYEREGKIIGVDETSAIRAQAVAAFIKVLDGKLANLQPGEHLTVAFDINIIGVNRKVRGGSGAERNMPEYIAWRKAVYERDGYRCRECGSGDRLNAHHVQAWTGHPELRFEISNGVTLCNDCHKKRHPHLALADAVSSIKAC